MYCLHIMYIRERVGNPQEPAGSTWFSKGDQNWVCTLNGCCFIWRKQLLNYAIFADFQSHSPNITTAIAGVTVNSAVGPGVSLSPLSYKPHARPSHERLAAQVEAGGAHRQKGEPSCTLRGHPQTRGHTSLLWTGLQPATASWNGSPTVPNASIILSTSLAVGGNLRTAFLNLNIRNGSLLHLGHFEVEMYLALRVILYISSESLHPSHWDMPPFPPVPLASYRDCILGWVTGGSWGLQRLGQGLEFCIWIFLAVWLWARVSNSPSQSSLSCKNEMTVIVVPPLPPSWQGEGNVENHQVDSEMLPPRSDTLIV